MIRTALTAVLTAAFLLHALPADAQQSRKEKRAEEKRKKKEAQEQIAAFKKEAKALKDEGAIKMALTQLAKNQHDLILEEVGKWLTKGSESFQMGVAGILGRFKKNAKAAAVLVKVAQRHKSDTVIKECLRHVGEIGAPESAKALLYWIDYKREFRIEVAAVRAMKNIHSKILIEPLIKVLAQLEKIENNPYTADERQLQRKYWVTEPATEALRAITGQQKLTKSREWRVWWAKNKKTFKGK